MLGSITVDFSELVKLCQLRVLHDFGLFAAMRTAISPINPLRYAMRSTSPDSFAPRSSGGWKGLWWSPDRELICSPADGPLLFPSLPSRALTQHQQLGIPRPFSRPLFRVFLDRDESSGNCARAPLDVKIRSLHFRFAAAWEERNKSELKAVFKKGYSYYAHNSQKLHFAFLGEYPAIRSLCHERAPSI